MTLGYVVSLHSNYDASNMVSSSKLLLLVQIFPLHQISHTISPKPMISMLLEERLVMYIGVGIVTVRRRRFEFGA